MYVCIVSNENTPTGANQLSIQKNIKLVIVNYNYIIRDTQEELIKPEGLIDAKADLELGYQLIKYLNGNHADIK